MDRIILPEPPAELKGLSEALSDLIRKEINDTGPIPFSRYMEMALYQPGLGYYSAGLHKLGASGDFVTAPELGSLFAACVANQISQAGRILGEYDVLEIGAGTGRLAFDLLQSLEPDERPRRYMILERSADLQALQRETLAAGGHEWSGRVEWLDRPPVADWRGVVLANEVLDALAVERFRIAGRGVEQACVGDNNGSFHWTWRPAPAALEQAVKSLGLELPESYCSELSLLLPAWLEALTAGMKCGLALFIDYGYPRREYYLAERNDGTLICHYRHRAHDDVFFWPGLQDITAFVDFTALAEAGSYCGLELEGYTNQTMFLLGCGLDRVLAAHGQDCEDGGLSLNAQARQLTLPGMMGERFQVMGLGRALGPGQPLIGFSQLDLSHRL